jgi:hypothetical protein
MTAGYFAHNTGRSDEYRKHGRPAHTRLAQERRPVRDDVQHRLLILLDWHLDQEPLAI